MDWSARLAARRDEKFSESPSCSVPEVPKPPFGTFGTLQDGHSQNIAPDPAAIRASLHRLADADLQPPALVDSLPTAEIEACAGLADDVLGWYLHRLRDAALREAGKLPAGETARAVCRSCGPVWIAPEVAAAAPVATGWPRVLGCPWCHVENRHAMLRPPVECAGCRHFARDPVNPAGGMGRCTAARVPLPSEPLPYPHAQRQCERFDPLNDGATTP